MRKGREQRQVCGQMPRFRLTKMMISRFGVEVNPPITEVVVQFEIYSYLPNWQTVGNCRHGKIPSP
jgi:hypothetical protein